MPTEKNVKWNLAGSALPLLAAAVAIPYLLKSLGDDGFGLLTLVWALIGYFSFFDFGIGRALTFQLSCRTEPQTQEISRILKAGLVLTTATGVVGSLVVFAVTEVAVNDILKINSNWIDDAKRSFQIAAIGIAATTINNGLKGALEGLNNFRASNINKMITGSLMFLLPAASIYMHGNHIWICTIYMVAARVIVSLATSKKIWYLITTRTKSSYEHYGALLQYGGWISITGLVGPLMIYGDRFFVSAIIDAGQLSTYAIPQEGLQRLLLIPGAICGAMLPLLASMPEDEISKVYPESLKRISNLMLLICSIAAVCSYPILSIWISPAFAKSSVVVTLILAVGIYLNSIALVPYTVLHAMGKPKITAIFHVAELFLYILLVWGLTSAYGIEGAALAWTLRVLLDFLLLHITVKQTLSNIECHAK